MNFYVLNAQRFAKETLGIDMTPIYQKFTYHIEKGDRILDLGCGAGRDLKNFIHMGYEAIGRDPSSEMVKIAKNHANTEVHEGSAEDITAFEEFDGVWACASLLHTPYKDLAQTLNTVARSIKPRGIFYCSFKKGPDERQTEDGRHFTDMNETRILDLLPLMPSLDLLETWTNEDIRPKKDGIWFNILFKKQSAPLQ